MSGGGAGKLKRSKNDAPGSKITNGMKKLPKTFPWNEEIVSLPVWDPSANEGLGAERHIWTSIRDGLTMPGVRIEENLLNCRKAILMIMNELEKQVEE